MLVIYLLLSILFHACIVIAEGAHILVIPDASAMPRLGQSGKRFTLYHFKI
ncbi:hypothetical protein SAMN05660226_03367 [Parapedobacter luteus]|uniref:Uncharacterized protein n=1 Tax=Parapedobacter luteus TaxID=623280 RepID=A0A1T5EKD2_9SPHI|nr:hypothetical protein [Parapedobacter luteus]SKB84366.1 hypothetical protein SAMN05660226_03367 [Parapedobacter luteus]